MGIESYESAITILEWLQLRGIVPGTEVSILKGKHAGKVGKLLGSPSRSTVSVTVGELFTPGVETILTTPENIQAVNRPDMWSKEERAEYVQTIQNGFAGIELESLIRDMETLTLERIAYNEALREYRVLRQYENVARMQRDALRCTVLLEIYRELAAVVERYVTPVSP